MCQLEQISPIAYVGLLLGLVSWDTYPDIHTHRYICIYILYMCCNLNGIPDFPTTQMLFDQWCFAHSGAVHEMSNKSQYLENEDMRKQSLYM